MAIPIPGMCGSFPAPPATCTCRLFAPTARRPLGGMGRAGGDHILVCTSGATWKAKDMRRHPRLTPSVTDMANPHRMAAIQGRVVEARPGENCRYMDPISFKYTNAPFPSRGPDRVCFVIAVEKAAQQTLSVTPPSAVTRTAANRPASATRLERSG